MIVTALHGAQLPADGLHVIHALVYADEATRLADTLSATDVGKVAFQSDLKSFWILTANPNTWKQIAGPPTIRTEATTARTLSAADADSRIQCTNAAAVTITVPTNAVVPFPLGTTILFDQVGAGKVTVSGAGVTFRNTLPNSTAAQNAVIGITKVGTDTWSVVGERG